MDPAMIKDAPELICTTTPGVIVNFDPGNTVILAVITTGEFCIVHTVLVRLKN